jgi:hypothetical protein
MLAFIFDGNWVSFLYEDPTYHKSTHIKYALQMALKMLKITTIMLLTTSLLKGQMPFVVHLSTQLILLFSKD